MSFQRNEGCVVKQHWHFPWLTCRAPSFQGSIKMNIVQQREQHNWLQTMHVLCCSVQYRLLLVQIHGSQISPLAEPVGWMPILSCCRGSGSILLHNQPGTQGHTATGCHCHRAPPATAFVRGSSLLCWGCPSLLCWGQTRSDEWHWCCVCLRALRLHLNPNGKLLFALGELKGKPTRAW